MNDDYKYNVYKQNTVHNNEFKTIWYITDADLKQYRCSYTLSSIRSAQTAQMNRILLSKEPVKYAIYRIIINTHKYYNDDIFFRIYSRNNKNWQQITHLTKILGYSHSNHVAKKYNGLYAWKISKQDAVYLLDSRANEANSSYMYDKKKHSKYYDVVINQLVIHLYENINKLYSPYEVLKTLNYIYELLTDKQQLNWSYIEDIPVQSYILSLQSRISSMNHCIFLVSLFAFLCTGHRDEWLVLDDKLKIMYNQLSDDDKCIDSLRILLNDDTKLINNIKHMLLLERKRNLNNCSVKSYYYLLWYNLICACTRNTTQVSHLTQVVKQQIANSKLNLDELLFIAALDQKIPCLQNKEFLLTNILMNKVIDYLKKMDDLRSRQKTLFAVIDMIMDPNTLYDTLKKYKTFVFGCVIIETNYGGWSQFLEKIKNSYDHQLKLFVLNEFCCQTSMPQNVNELLSRQKILFAVINMMTNTNDLYVGLKKYKTLLFGSVITKTDFRVWLRFVRILFQKITIKYHNQLKLFVLNGFCSPIRQISDPQKSNDFFTLYNEWTQFMDCSLIQNTILQNNFLIAQKRFIVACASKLRSMKPSRFKGYLYLWIKYFSANELFEIFKSNAFNLMPLTRYLAQSIETEGANTNKAIELCKTYKQQNDILVAENESLNVKITKHKSELTKSNEEQQKRIAELSNQLKKYENKLNQYRQENKRLNESKQTQQQIINEQNYKLKKYENKINHFKENNVRLNDECKELNSELTEMQRQYDKLYHIHNIDTKKYKNWNYNNITDWIISLNEEYKIYENVLRSKLKEEQLQGLYLCDLNNDDLDRFGIKAFKHKKSIMNEIKKLNGVNQDDSYDNAHLKNDKMEAEGCQIVTAYHDK